MPHQIEKKQIQEDEAKTKNEKRILNEADQKSIRKQEK